MKRIILLFVVGLIQLNAFSQTEYKKIRVSNDIELVKLSDNAYLHVSCSKLEPYGRVASNGLIYINGNEAFLFDTPMTDALTKDLFNYINDSMKLTIVGFVPNHWHVDCIGGLNFIQDQRIESYANQMTIDIAMSKNLPVPIHGFMDSLELKLGDKFIECYYLGPAHTLDNIVIWMPSEKILFAGCMIKSLSSKDLGNTVDGDLIAYSKTIDKLINKFPTAKIVIPGHGQIGGLELIRHTKELSTRK